MNDTVALNCLLRREKDGPNEHAFISSVFLSAPSYTTNLVAPFFVSGRKR